MGCYLRLGLGLGYVRGMGMVLGLGLGPELALGLGGRWVLFITTRIYSKKTWRKKLE